MEDSDSVHEEDGDSIENEDGDSVREEVSEGVRDDSGDTVLGEEGDSVQEDAEERQHERTAHVEDVLAEVREDLGNQKYPVSSEELSATYADQPFDLPNETESLAGAFRRIDGSFEDAQAAYDALVTEYEQGEHLEIRSDAIGPEGPTWGEERAETQHEFREDPIDDEAHESSVERSRERAREAQAESASESEPESEDEQ